MHRDFKELLSAFNEGHVKYLVVGGYAVSMHAEPRATKDLDILVGADAENSKAVYAALAKFGAPVEGLTAKDFTDLDSLFRMGTPPVMVDIMPRISGIEFEDAWQRRVNIPIDENLTAPFISRQDLLAAKMAAGRAQDLIDADALRTSAPHRENQPLQSPTEGSRAFETIRQAQERGVEEWLKLRQGQLTDGKMPTLEEIQTKGREEWMRYREQQNEKSQHPNDNSEGNDRPIDSDHEGFTKNDIKEIDDDLGL
jgi:hypothetical protein